jgi:MFS family permease
MICLLAFSLFTLGAGLSKSFASLVMCRFFAGAFGGAMLVLGFGLLADIWTSKQLPVALSIFNVVPFCGPSAGFVYNPIRGMLTL